jgi:hypothetical protein
MFMKVKPLPIFAPGSGGDVPPELFPLIISSIAGKRDLENACLVSKAWCTFARRSLFSSITLSSWIKLDKFSTHFRLFPNVAAFVRSVEIDEHNIGIYDTTDRTIDDIQENLVPPALPNLSHLSIIGYTKPRSSLYHVPGEGKQIRSLSLDGCKMELEDLVYFILDMPLRSMTFTMDLAHPPTALKPSGPCIPGINK